VILVTGSNGFVGTALCRTLRERGVKVRGAVRGAAGEEQVTVGDLSARTDWHAALAGCSCVIHVAARVHVMDDTDADQLAAYRAVNVDGTMQLARQAHAAGVKRMLFVSSIKVNGESTTGKAPYTATDTPLPVDPYGVSKMEAEIALRAFAAESGLEVVIVRPPLVYGPGVKANFADLLRLVKLGVPLPFASVKNYRSMVALDNLVDLLIVCTLHPAAPGHVFLVSDGTDTGIAGLISMIGKAMGKRAILLPCPVSLMAMGARLLGKSSLVDRLFGSLQVDIAATRATLGWTPRVGMQQAINDTVAALLSTETKKKQ
jgi:nucleoside-diphosphate-sugar epimerase